MFGSKQRKARRALIAAIQADGRRVRAHLAAQALFAADLLGVARERMWQDAYSRGYVFGAFASLLADVPAERHDDTTTSLIDSGFLNFAVNAFGIGERAARDGLDEIVRRQGAVPLRHAIADGRADGIQMRQGLPATLWLAHLLTLSPRAEAGRSG